MRPLSNLKGIGPARASRLRERGLTSLLDLLYLLPRRYRDARRIYPIAQAPEGREVLVSGRIVGGREHRFPRSGKRLYSLTLKDPSGTLELLFFHYRKAHLDRLCRSFPPMMVWGLVRTSQGRRTMIHPQILAEENGRREFHGLQPVYPAVEGIPPRVLRHAVQGALLLAHSHLREPLPRDLLLRLHLPSLSDAIQMAHRPPPETSFEELETQNTSFQRRLRFDAYLGVILALKHRGLKRRTRNATPLVAPRDFWHALGRAYPFPFTPSQQKAIHEILGDLRKNRPMARLLQGDVGSGKTVVALAAAYAAVANRAQVAFMAPTQILAQQHFLECERIAPAMGFRPLLLTGALSASGRREAHRKVASGEANLVIGTHALLQEGIRFRNVALVLIDEQHRFGVRERCILEGKGHDPHVLIITATPIPRTLAMALYADLSVSTLTEYPGNRRPIRTLLVPADRREEVYQKLGRRLALGEQALVVCPAVEDMGESNGLKAVEEVHRCLTAQLGPSFRTGIIHGRLPPEEKLRVMEAFQRRQIHVLVGTTVLEVGIHAPGASILVVENPERFGLSQLHQLRGRVGRKGQGGLCLLLVPDGIPDGARSRLRFLASCEEGLRIAEQDLALRGHGEMLGLRQWGRGEIDISQAARDADLLRLAAYTASTILKRDPSLSEPRHRPLRLWAESLSGDLFSIET